MGCDECMPKLMTLAGFVLDMVVQDVEVTRRLSAHALPPGR